MNVGVPCNVCEPDRDRYGIIMRMNPDGTGLEVFARGERNTVGFDWDPRTKELWFTDNGRDMMGDDVPPDTLNHAPRAGLRFRLSVLSRRHDSRSGVRRASARAASSRRRRRSSAPHVASLGMRFYTGTQFPAAYRNQIFIAEHGSWNRSSKVGYRVTLVKLDADGKPVSYAPFRRAGCRGAHGAARRTCSSRRTARCWCRTTQPARSTGFVTAALSGPHQCQP